MGAVIRDFGAEPAIIALLGGRMHIGLSDEELELLGRSGLAQKVSRRDRTCRRCWPAAVSVPPR